MAKKEVRIGVGFDVNKSGLETVRKSLQELSKMGLTQFKIINPQSTQEAKASLEQLKSSVASVQSALNKSYDIKLNTLDVKTFKQEIDNSAGGIKTLAERMNSAGTTGKAAFSDLTAEILTSQNAVKQTNKLLESMKTTFLNTVKWNLSSSVLNTFTGTIQKAWSYVQNLDESLNNIRIVTGKSNAEMEKFAKTANKAAKALGTSTTSYTDASLIYYQQGLGEKDVAARTNVTIKAANVTGQSAAEVSEQLTAVWNGYKVVAEEAELYVDKLAAVAATTAADLEELSTGMSKVASAANAMGIDVDQLSAQLSTIISVTRQDASVVGTALKTIYSRMGDLQVGGVDEFGVSLGQVSGQLQQMGINVLDQEGNLRDMGTVIEEVAGKWGTWTEAQQQAAAVAIAGKRQYNNLIALFENWDMYESSMDTSKNAEGTLEEQNEIYLDSFEAKFKKLKAASEGLFQNLIDSDSAKNMVDVLTKIVEVIDQLAQGMGGLGNILTLALGTLTKIFSSDIAKSLGGGYENHLSKKFNTAQNTAMNSLVSEYSDIDPKNLTAGQKKAVELKAEQLRLSKLLTEEEKENYNTLIKQTLELEKQEMKLTDSNKAIRGEIKSLGSLDGSSTGSEQVAENAGDGVASKYLQLQSRKTLATVGTVDAAISSKGKNSQKTLTKIESTNLTSASKERLKAISVSEKYRDVLAEVRKGTKLEGEQLDLFTDYLKETKQILSESATELDTYSKEIVENGEALEKTKAQQEAYNREVEKTKKVAKFKEVSQGITSLIGTTAQLASSMTMITNIFNIFRDDSLSGAEKAIQVIGAIGTAVGVLAPVVISSIKMISTTGQTEAAKLNMSLGVIGLVLAAVAIVLGVIMAILSKPKEPTALEQAKAAAEEAGKAAEEAESKVKSLSDAYDNLTSTISDYTAAQDAISKLTQGTDEWKNAVEKVNDQVFDLLTQYPELADGMQIIDGVYTLTDDAMNKVKAAEKAKLNNAKMISYKANITAAKAQQKLITEEAKSNIKAETIFGKDDKIKVNGEKVRLNSLLNDGTLSQEEKDALLEAGYSQEKLTEEMAKVEKTMSDARKAQEEQNKLIEANTRALLATIADKHGYDAEIFEILGKDENGNIRKTTDISIGSDVLESGVETKDNHNPNKDKYTKRYSDNESLKNLQQIFVKDTGKKVSTEGGRTLVATNIHNALVNALPNHKVVGPASSEFKENKKVEDLGSVKVSIDGEEMTVSDALSLAETDAYEQAILNDPDVQNLNKVIEAGGGEYNQAAALFMGGNKGSEWSSATLSSYDEISNYTGLGDDYAGNVAAGKAQFINDLKAKGFSDSEITKMTSFTQADAKSLASVKELAGAAGQGEKFASIMSSITDPEIYKQAAEAAKKVDWTSITSVADFYFKYMGDIQENLRKKELDYFKNINKELSKLNSEFERAIGLKGADLAQAKVNAAEESLGLAKNQLGRSMYVLRQYKGAYGDEYFTEDGAVDIEKVNQRISELDPEKGSEAEKEEHARLTALTEYWDYAIESEQQVQDMMDQYMDARIESFKYIYEYQKQLNEVFRKWDDFSLKFKDSLDDWDKSVALTKKDQAYASIKNAQQDYLMNMSALETIANDASFWRVQGLTMNSELGTSAPMVNYDAKKFELYKEELMAGIGNLEALQGGIEGLYDSYLDIQKEILANYDEEIAKREQIKSILQGSVDLMKLAGVSGTSTLMGNMTTYSAQEFSLAQQQLSAVQDEFKKLTEDGQEYSQDMLDNVTENLAAAGENVLAKGQEYYAAIANQFAEEMSNLIDNAVKIKGASSLAGVSEAWELATSSDSRYLDSVNEAYAMSSLERQFNASIEATDNIAAQNKLLTKQSEIQQKLARIKEEQGKLAQADLDRANAEYELTLKQIALEEAQQTSSKMKLTRDALGNYTYQYVADQDAIAKAEEELAAAENNLYNMDKDRTQSLVSEYYSTMSEANSQIAEAMAENDQERVTRLKEYYFGKNGLLAGIQTELGFASSNLEVLSDVYSTFTDSILATDKSGNSVIDNLASGIDTLLYGEDEDSDEDGAVGAMKTLSSTISSLFGSNGALANLPDQMSQSLSEKIDNSELTAASTQILSDLPDLLEQAKELKDMLGGETGFIASFKSWLEERGTDENGEETVESKIYDSVNGIFERLENGLSIEIDNDGNYVLTFAANTTAT